MLETPESLSDPRASDVPSSAATPADRPLRVAAVYPAFDPAVNELAQIWAALARDGHVDCRVLAGAKDTLKGHMPASMHERLPGLEIRRVDGALHSRNHADELIPDELIRWAADVQPDVIVSSCDFLTGFGRRIRALHPAPHLLHVEQWFSPGALARREYLGVPALRPLAGRIKRRRYDRFVDHYMIANPAERDTMGSAADASRYDYVAWPHPPQVGVEDALPLEARARDRLVYVGSISKWKGAVNLGRYVDAFLAASPDARATIVGPAVDDAGKEALALLARWGDRCERIPSLPRAEALRLIGESLAVFCPSDEMGWGQIGDAFNMGTPIIGVGAFYELRDDVNALIARQPADLAHCFDALRADPALWSRIAHAGRDCVRNEHSPEAVGRGLLRALHHAAGAPRGR